MKRFIIYCSTCILLCASIVRADLLYSGTKNLSNHQSQYTKLAAVYEIMKKGSLSFSGLDFSQKQKLSDGDTQCPANMNRIGGPLYKKTLPSNCSEATNSCIKDGERWYSVSCKTCSGRSYVLVNGFCTLPSECWTQWGGDFFANKGNGCGELFEEYGNKIGTVKECSQYAPDGNSLGGGETVFAYSSCAKGYKLKTVAGRVGCCEVDECDSREFPYSTAPEICRGDYLTCRQGEETLYGCAECNIGYIQDRGLCAKVECGSGFGDSCPAHGTCEECQSGEDTKYKLTGCAPTYELQDGVCVRQKALAFTVTTTGANQSIDLALKGPFEIDWGDGNNETGTGTTTLYSGGTIGNPDSHSHTFAAAGSYNVYVAGTPAYAGVRSGNSYITELLDISLPSITSYWRTFSPSSSNKASNMSGDITNMTFPSGLKNATGMFSNISGLTGTVPTLPSGLKYTGASGSSGMFEGCTGLTGSIPTLPSGLITADYMFKGCTGLTGTIPVLPNSLTSGLGMFKDCTGLSGSIPELPSNLTIGTWMFSGCTGLSGSIPALPSSLTNGNAMFKDCTGLTGDLPDLPGVMTNGRSMFSGDSGIVGCQPTIPESCTDCTSIYAGTNTSGTCPLSNISFTVTTTAANQSIKIVTTGNATVDWGDEATQNITGTNKGTSHSYSSAGSYTVVVTGTPTSFQVSSGASYITELHSISLRSITSYNNAFYNATNMTGDLSTMRFPKGLTNANGMFSGCTGLTGSIPELPSGLTSGNSMFSDCTGLTGSIPELPRGLSIGGGMFYGCTGLTGTIPALPSGLTNGTGMFSGCTGLTGTIPALPSGLTDGTDMFSGCTGLTGTIPAFPRGLTIGGYMFQGCTGLTGNIPALPSGLIYGDSMFSGCSNLTGCQPTIPESCESCSDMVDGTNVTTTCSVGESSVSFRVTTSSANQSINLSIQGNYTIDWGDGNTESGIGTSATHPGSGSLLSSDHHPHTYAAAGDYDVSVTGTPIYVGITEGKQYVTHLWDISLPSIISYENSFSGTSITNDISNLVFPNGLINGMGMFSGSRITGSIPTLPSGLKFANAMFAGCGGLTGSIPTLPSGLQYAEEMFAGCIGLTGNIPTLPSGLEYANAMFAEGIGLTGNIPTLPSGLIGAEVMFVGCTGLTGCQPEIPASCENCSGMFDGTATDICQ